MKPILIVDDDPVQLRTREEILRGAGFEVHAATSAAAALALLRAARHSVPIGLVITDHVMPKENGAEFVRALRAVDGEVRVAVVTGMPDIESDYEGLEVTLFPKPFHPLALIALAREAVA